MNTLNAYNSKLHSVAPFHFTKCFHIYWILITALRYEARDMTAKCDMEWVLKHKEDVSGETGEIQMKFGV